MKCAASEKSAVPDNPALKERDTVFCNHSAFQWDAAPEDTVVHGLPETSDTN